MNIRYIDCLFNIADFLLNLHLFVKVFQLALLVLCGKFLQLVLVESFKLDRLGSYDGSLHPVHDLLL